MTAADEARARWRRELAPILRGRSGQCIECDATIFPAYRGRIPKRCVDCTRKNAYREVKEWRARNPERQRAQRGRALARKGQNLEDPDARRDENGNRICWDCGQPLTRKATKWPRRCETCKRLVSNARQREWYHRRKVG